MKTIEVNGIKYQVRQTNSQNEKWVQTNKGERIAIYSSGIWKWKFQKRGEE